MRKLLILIPIISFVSACSSTQTKEDIAEQEQKIYQIKMEQKQKEIELKQKENEDTLEQSPDWALDPPRSDNTGVFGIGMSSDENLVNAIKKAKLQAYFSVAQTLKSELSGEDTINGSGSNNYRYIINNFVDKVDLSGSEVVKQKVNTIAGNYKAYVLIKYPFKQFNQILKDMKESPQKESLKASYKRLMDKTKNETTITTDK
jgi:hypothetical protein